MLDNLYIVECFRVYAASSSYYICLVKCAVKTVELNLYFFLKIVYKINHILNLYFFKGYRIILHDRCKKFKFHMSEKQTGMYYRNL